MRLSTDFPIQCPGCGKRYYVPENMAGADVTCGACSSDFSIPSPLPLPASTASTPAAPISADRVPAMDAAQTDPPPGPNLSTHDPKPAAPPAPARPRWIAPALLFLTGAAAVFAGAEWLRNQKPTRETAAAPAPQAPVPSAAAKQSPEPPPGKSPENDTREAQMELLVPDPVVVPDPVDKVAAPPDEPQTAQLAPGADVTVSGTSPAAEAADDSLKPAPEPATGPTPPDPALIRRDPRKTIDHFLAATSMEGRLALSQYPEKIRPAMLARNQNAPAKAFPAVMVDLLTTGNVPGTQRSFHLYNVFLKNREAPIPVAVEKTADGYRVDWQTFIECHDQTLKAFFDDPSAEPSRFRVSLRRTHYFGKPVPGQDRERIAFKVEAPTRDESFYVWADKNSSLLKEQLSTGGRGGWDAESYVIAELRWRGDDRQGRWVGLEKIISDSWRPE